MILLCAVPIVFEQVAAQDGKILEDTEAECEQGDVVEVNAETVADKDERRSKQCVREESRDKDMLVEALCNCSSEAAECGVKRRNERDGKEL